MSKYTTEVRFLCESFNKNKAGGYTSIDENIEAGVKEIFSFSFPIFDSEYKNVLCTKILRHYYTREIGEETYGLWKLRLETKMNEIMPYYNKLYTSGLTEFNPLWDTQLKTEYIGNEHNAQKEDEKTIENKTLDEVNNKQNDINSGGTQQYEDSGKVKHGSSETEDKTGIDKYSDTPQGGIDGVINDDYLTNARIIDNSNLRKINGEDDSLNKGFTNFNNTYRNTENESKSEAHKRDEGRNKTHDSTTTEDYVIKVTGRQGTDIGKQLKELKETLLNIDMMIISELETLFMNIW